MVSQCTCRRPITVDLPVLDQIIDNVVIDQIDTSARNQLFTNLEHCGWSPIRINVDDSDFVRNLSSEAQDLLLQRYCLWKELHQEMFINREQQPENPNAAREKGGVSDGTTNTGSSLTFIASESGSSDRSLVEAKQSWELKLHDLSTTGNKQSTDLVTTGQLDHSGIRLRMQCWAEILHAAARLVRKTLNFPKHVVLHERADDKEECLDILRAFSYDSSKGGVGSSPHTDWGTFTIIWQDETPDSCLQTHCRVHDTWNDVITMNQTSGELTSRQPQQHVLSLVVHVGDILSLAIGHTVSTLASSGGEAPKQVWPSPRHRVLAPVTQLRNSLVYFAYPPARSSIATIGEALQPWCRQYYGNVHHDAPLPALPLKDYSLLQDQSLTKVKLTDEELLTSVKNRYCKCVDQPVATILREKWMQVQR